MKDAVIVSGCVLFLILLFRQTKAFESCLTPDKDQGECKPIKSCKPILAIIRKKPINDSERMFLRRSQCGNIERFPWVCCPNEKVSTQIPRTSTSLQLNPSVCGRVNNKIPNRIFGGSETRIGEFPWMALLVYEKENRKTSLSCGGVLITQTHVLSAAHCVAKELIPFTWKLSKVRLGEWDKTSNPDCQFIDGKFQCAPDSIDVEIAAIYIHENYDVTNINKLHDIALLRLASTIAFTEFVKPICLPIDTFKNIFNAEYGSATATGFGKTEDNSTSHRMLKVEIDIVSQANCRRKYRDQGREIQNSQICAIRYNADTCNGDSGSPLIKERENDDESLWYLIGITSYGPALCGTTSYPGIYTNVIHYIEWIKAKIKL